MAVEKTVGLEEPMMCEDREARREVAVERMEEADGVWKEEVEVGMEEEEEEEEEGAMRALKYVREWPNRSHHLRFPDWLLLAFTGKQFDWTETDKSRCG